MYFGFLFCFFGCMLSLTTLAASYFALEGRKGVGAGDDSGKLDKEDIVVGIFFMGFFTLLTLVGLSLCAGVLCYFNTNNCGNMFTLFRSGRQIQTYDNRISLMERALSVDEIDEKGDEQKPLLFSV